MVPLVSSSTLSKEIQILGPTAVLRSDCSDWRLAISNRTCPEHGLNSLSHIFLSEKTKEISKDMKIKVVG